MLQNITGRRLSAMLEMTVLMTSCIIVGVVISWQIGLSTLAYFPVLAFAFVLVVCLNSPLILFKLMLPQMPPKFASHLENVR